jgi:hypothetical protein
MRTDIGFVLHQDLDNFVRSSTTACFPVAADVRVQKAAIPLSLYLKGLLGGEKVEVARIWVG